MLLIRKDLSITRRVNTWLFGPPDMDNKYHVTEENSIVLKYLIYGFEQIFNLEPKSR